MKLQPELKRIFLYAPILVALGLSGCTEGPSKPGAERGHSGASTQEKHAPVYDVRADCPAS